MERHTKRVWVVVCISSVVLFVGGLLWWFMSGREPASSPITSPSKSTGLSLPVGDGQYEEVADILELPGANFTVYLGTSLAKHVSPDEFKTMMEGCSGTVVLLHGMLTNDRILFVYRQPEMGVAASHFGRTNVTESLTIVTLSDIDPNSLRMTLVHEFSHANMGALVRHRHLLPLLDEGMAQLAEVVAGGNGCPKHEELLRNAQELGRFGILASSDGTITPGLEALQSPLAGDLFLKLWEKTQGRSTSSIVQNLVDNKLQTWNEFRDFCREILGEDHPIFLPVREGTYVLRLAHDLATAPKDVIAIFRRDARGGIIPLTVVGVSDAGVRQTFSMETGVFAIDIHTLREEFRDARSVSFFDDEENFIDEIHFDR